MAKKQARVTTAKKAKKATRGKKDGTLATSAKRVGQALGRAAKAVDKAKAAVKKSAAKRANTKPKIDPEVEAARARTRDRWKSQAQEANSVELAKHGALVDERARVRSLTGMSWSNRKPR